MTTEPEVLDPIQAAGWIVADELTETSGEVLRHPKNKHLTLHLGLCVEPRLTFVYYGKTIADGDDYAEMMKSNRPLADLIDGEITIDQYHELRSKWRQGWRAKPAPASSYTGIVVSAFAFLALGGFLLWLIAK